MQAEHAIPRDWANFQPGPMQGATLMQAHFRSHAFERHSHPTYSIGLTHSGVQTFHCGGALHASLPGDLILFNPDEAHDGQRGAPEGFGYSILYLPADVMGGCVDPQAGIVFPLHFRQPVVRDRRAGQAFARAVAALNQPGEALRAEELTRDVLSAILLRHGEPGPRKVRAGEAGARRLAALRDYLHANYQHDVAVQDLATAAGLSRAHTTRAFTQAFGVPPHVYLNAVRLVRAQSALLAGGALADVAVACGFADQSHFSRRFKGAFGISPAAWLAQMRAPPRVSAAPGPRAR